MACCVAVAPRSVRITAVQLQGQSVRPRLIQDVGCLEALRHKALEDGFIRPCATHRYGEGLKADRRPIGVDYNCTCALYNYLFLNYPQPIL